MDVRSLTASLVLCFAAGCGSSDAPSSPGGEDIGQTAEPLTAQCKANVQGAGLLDTETVYLPNVVHCENGGAPLEALKAQAIAARTFLYYKLETAGSIGDGQGDQVYSCGSTADAQQKQAVLDTAGIVLRYKSETIASFFVAGGAASAPSCKGGSAATEPYVTYNEGLSGSALHQTTLGYVSPTNYRNRGCMSQLGSRCLASEGKTYEEILKFYYGADIVLEQATGPCVPTPVTPQDGGATKDGGGSPKPDGGAGTRHEGDSDAGSSPPEDLTGASTHGDALADTGGSCAASPTSRAPSGFAILALAAALALGARRKRLSALSD